MGLTSLFHTNNNASKLDPSILIDRYHRARFFVLSVLFGQFFTLGIIRPELPQLLISVFSGNVSYVSIYQGITEGVGAIVAFVALPIIGVYSDNHGRKPALFITAIFATFAPLTLCFYPTLLSAEVVLVIFLLGSSVFKLNSFSVVLSYVADCQNIVHWAKEQQEQQEQQNASANDLESGVNNNGSTLTPLSPLIQIGSPSNSGGSKFSVPASPTVGQTFKQKESSGPPSMSHAFGAASATCFFAQTLGPFLVQYLTRTESLMLATFLSVLSIIFSFLLPETVGVVPHDHGPAPAAVATKGTANERTALLSAPNASTGTTNEHNKPSTDRSSKTSVLKRMTLTFEFMREDRLYFLILLLTMISQLAVFGVGQVYYLFLIGGLHFSRVDTLTAAIIGGVETILILLVVLPLVNKRVGDNALLLVAFASYVLYCLLVSAAQTKADAFAVIIFWAISEMVRPIFSSLLAVYAPANKQGLAQGALTSMRGLASGIGPFLFAIIFSLAAKSVPVPHEGAANANATPAPPSSSEHPSPSSGRFTIGYWSFSEMAITFFIAAFLSYVSFILALYLPLPSSSSDKTEIQFKRARPTRSFANRLALGTFGTVFILGAFATVEWAERKYLDPTPITSPTVAADFSTAYAKSLCASSHCDMNLFERYSNKRHAPSSSKHQTEATESAVSSYKLNAHQTQKLKKLSPLHLAFLGAPGVGKTSFADSIAPLLGLCHVATGVLIRSEIASGSALGASIADIVHSGGLVNDTVVTQLLMNRLKEKDCEGGFILDGFPRRTSQAEILSNTPSLRLHAVLDLEMDRELVLSRVSGRRVCPKCGLTYNIAGIVDAKEGYNIPPRLPKQHSDIDHLKCDADGTPLEKRADDQAEIARHRMEIYEKETAPLIEYYSNKKENIIITWNIHKGVEEELSAVISLILKQSLQTAIGWTKTRQQ